NHSPDLKRLRDEGNEIEVRRGYLLIDKIPFDNQTRKRQQGVLVSTLTISGKNRTTASDNHDIHLIGNNTCEVAVTIITSIQHSNANSVLNHQITVNRSFSNKPAAGYPNYYEKVKRYADIISAPAKYLDPSVTEKTFRMIADSANETVFQYI